MPSNGASFTPTVEWAQRKDVLFLSIVAEDCKDPTVEFSGDNLRVSGYAGPNKRPFDANVEFYKSVDADKTRRVPSDRCIQLVIPKKEAGAFWPRLLKSEKKAHWLKVDFDKWKDEDDEDDDDGMNWDVNDVMGKLGGFGDGKADLDDSDDSDNEDGPELEDDPRKNHSGQEEHVEGMESAR